MAQISTARRSWPCLATVLFLTASGLAPAQTTPEVYYTRQPEIRIPFRRDAGNQFKQVQLCVSTDQGRDWQPVLTATPDVRSFQPYLFPADGTYWFATRMIDFQDRPYPKTLGELTPQLKVILDRKPPVVSLRQITDSRPGIVSVEWDVRDENFDPRRFALEYRVSTSDWQREAAAKPEPTGVQSWRLEPGVRMEVRLRVADKAGNDADQTIPVGFTADGRPIDPPATASSSTGGSTSSGSGQGGIFYSKSMRISIGYKFDRRPISGIQVFDLWYTTDRGAHWTKAPLKGDSAAGGGSLPATPGTGGAEVNAGKLIFEATTQGLYGFIPVARNGVGIGDADPKPGDAPKYLVMVDTDAPKVAIKVQPGQGYDVKNVRIEWSADDANLADRPVTLEFAEVKADGTPPTDGDWKAIPQDNLAGRLDRSGVQVWSVGKNGPFKFLVRAKAEDKAGNVGTDQWRDPIVVDLEHPSVNITGIEPAGPR
jgi:hypothetical protein